MKLDVNLIPEQIKSGTISEQQALHNLAVFILQNPGIFGLQLKDEDFLSEVVTRFLEKDRMVFENFNPDYGSFFTYFFCYMKSIIVNCNRSRAVTYTKENHYVHESILNYENTLEAYSKIDYEKIESPKIPFRYEKVSVEEFQLACKNETYQLTPVPVEIKNNKTPLGKKINQLTFPKLERLILVLALKSSYYLTDEQIVKISRMCNIDEYIFRDAIYSLNRTLEERIFKQRDFVQRRNHAYYLRKKYETQLENITNAAVPVSEYSVLKIERKYNTQNNHWLMLNELLENGIVTIRPTNKAIAEVMGLCERQISYYLSRAKKLELEM